MPTEHYVTNLVTGVTKTLTIAFQGRNMTRVSGIGAGTPPRGHPKPAPQRAGAYADQEPREARQ
jgi:hypothetical protein